MLAATSACADEPFYKGKRLTLLINCGRRRRRPTSRAGCSPNTSCATSTASRALIVQNSEGAGGLVGADLSGRGRAARRHHARLFQRDRLELRQRAGALARRPARLRVRRLPVRHHHPLHAHRRAARHEASPPTSPRRRASSPAGSRSTIRRTSACGSALDMLGVPYRYVTGYRIEHAGAARAAARRDSHVLGIAAELSRVIEPALVKSGEVMPVWYDTGGEGDSAQRDRVDGRARDPIVHRTAPEDRRAAAVGAEVGSVPHHPSRQLDAAAAGRAAAGRTAGRCGGAARGGRASQP